MSGIPWECACTVVMCLRQNIANFVDDMFKCPTQQKANSCMFHRIETCDIPKVHDDGFIRDVVGNVYFSLKSSRTK